MFVSMFLIRTAQYHLHSAVLFGVRIPYIFLPTPLGALLIPECNFPYFYSIFPAVYAEGGGPRPQRQRRSG